MPRTPSRRFDWRKRRQGSVVARQTERLSTSRVAASIRPAAAKVSGTEPLNKGAMCAGLRHRTNPDRDAER